MTKLANWSMCSIIVLGLLAWAPLPASAAMRNCLKLVVGQGTAANELAAKKQAMAEWKKAAVTAGIENPAWRIAINKTFECEPDDGGQITCTASGDPCTITQVPPASTAAQ